MLEDSSRNRSIEYQVWMPEHEAGAGKWPLVLLSHGSGGDYSNHLWLIDELVENGFIVAALNHPLNTARDNTDEGVISVWQRPADMSFLLDHLLQGPQWADAIDHDRIGAAGFSTGGYTALAMVGAIYSKERMNAYCASETRAKDCDLATDFSKIDYTHAPMSYLDERIKSVFAMAPAVGPALTPESLGKINKPVFITAAQDDELVSPELGAINLSSSIPTSELHMIPSGGHFIFLECNAITTVVDWFIKDLDLCGTQFDVDREKVRSQVAAQAVNFFAKIIGV